MNTKPRSKLKAKPPELDTPGKAKILIFGPSGVGKTWFATSFPKPYYIDTEGGSRLKHYKERIIAAGGHYLSVEDGSLDFPTVIEQFEGLATEKHGFQTLIVDSITKLYQTAIQNEADRLGDKDAFGASKKPAISFMRRMCAWLTKIDMNVILIAHEVNEWGIDGKTGQRTEVGKMEDAWDKLRYELDLTLQAQKRGPSRVAIVRKTRLTGFPEAETFAMDYALFAERYGKDFIEGEVKPIVLASAEQVSQIKALLEVVRITDAEIAKVFTSASVESWEELTVEQANKTIAWLTKKTQPTTA